MIGFWRVKLIIFFVRSRLGSVDLKFFRFPCTIWPLSRFTFGLTLLLSTRRQGERERGRESEWERQLVQKWNWKMMHQNKWRFRHHLPCETCQIFITRPERHAVDNKIHLWFVQCCTPIFNVRIARRTADRWHLCVLGRFYHRLAIRCTYRMSK